MRTHAAGDEDPVRPAIRPGRRVRIAFVSYEFAGTATGGGIGTYVRGAAAMMAARGHEVEVFTSAPADPRVLPVGVVVHAAPVERQRFAHAVASVFAQRHIARPFDVIERISQLGRVLASR